MSDRISRASSSEVTQGGNVGEESERAGADALQPGAELGRYVLLRPLAAGGMGIVYLAFDPELDRNVALKLLLPRAQAQQDEPERLIAEARALAKLSHPNVIQVYDVGRWRDRVYVALEYVAGQTLDAWLRSRGRTWREILDALLDAGRGLAAAHRVDIVHLDIKPSNILIGDDGVVRVLDFGLSRSVVVPLSDGSTTSGAGSQAAVVGTVGYIAPEQFLGHAPDARSDQFGFCVTAWEALSGSRPFAGRTRREYERALFDTTPRAASGKGVPERVYQVLRSGMALRPASRRSDMDTLLQALSGAASRWTPARKALAAGAVVGFGVTAAAWRMASVETPCPDAADALAAVWSEARAATIAASFAATELPYATTAWTAARRALDDRTAVWSRTHQQNCVATQVHAIRPEAAYVRSLACLTARRDEIDALLGIFERADAGVVESAAAAARALPASSTCLDESTASELAAGSDIELVESLAAQLAEAWALAESSRFERALEICERVVKEARRGGLVLVEARGLLLQGHAASRLGHVREAVALIEQGIRTADAAGADDDRLGGLSALVYVAGTLGGDAARAHWHARIAEGLLRRLGGRSTRRSVLLLNEGSVFSDEGRFDDALAAYRAALESWRSGAGGIDETLATIFNNFGSLHLARGEHGAAAAWFVHAYLVHISLSGPEHPAIADVLVNQGNVLLNLGETDLALEHNRRALAILENARGRDDISTRVVLNNIGVILQEQGRFTEARAVFERALVLWRSIDANGPTVGVVLGNIADGDLAQGDANAALVGFRQSYELLARVLPEGHLYRTFALAGIGRATLALGDPARAVGLLRSAVDAADTAGAPDEQRAEPRFALARALAMIDAEPAIVFGISRQARREYVALGTRGVDKVAEIDRWLLAQSGAEAAPP